MCVIRSPRFSRSNNVNQLKNEGKTALSSNLCYWFHARDNGIIVWNNTKRKPRLFVKIIKALLGKYWFECVGEIEKINITLSTQISILKICLPGFFLSQKTRSVFFYITKTGYSLVKLVKLAKLVQLIKTTNYR